MCKKCLMLVIIIVLVYDACEKPFVLVLRDWARLCRLLLCILVIHIHIHAHTHTNVCTHIHTQTYAHARTHTHRCIHEHTNTHTYRHTDSQTQTHCTNIHTRIHMNFSLLSFPNFNHTTEVLLYTSYTAHIHCYQGKEFRKHIWIFLGKEN